jgi:small subunit ribosomal protein S9
MADDEPQSPDDPERSEEQAAAFAEHRAVPTEEAAEIAGSVEDAPLEAFEEARSAAEEAVVEEAVAELAAEEAAVDEAIVEELVEELVVGEAVAELVAEEAAAEPSVGVEQPSAEAEEEDLEEEDEEEPAPRVKPAVPGAHLEVDIVPEGVDPLAREAPEDPYAIEDEETEAAGEQEEAEEEQPQPISTAAIDLAAGARYRATGKRKTAIARVILRPGSGVYRINGRTLEEHFPRVTLQRNIRQPLETVGYEERMDVVARLHGGGISAQAGALRHGISRALLEADPNLRGELKRRGFLTRDSRAKERKKAGLKKARKRPQFSKR